MNRSTAAVGQAVPPIVEELAALVAMDDGKFPPGFSEWVQANRARAEAIAGGQEALKAAFCAEAGTAAGNERRWSEAAAHWERAVHLQPACNNYRFHYGTSLWLTGRWDEAVMQLQECCRRQPEWDMPFVEIGILYLNRGLQEPGPLKERRTGTGLCVCCETSWTQKALQHLDAGRDKFESTSAWFNHKRGVVLWQLNNLPEAQEALERAVKLNPKSGAAWDLAAECAFLRNDRLTGKRYAKKARDLGFRTAHDRWDV